MTTEIGSFLDWFEQRCVRAEALGFVELGKKGCHAKARGKRSEKRVPLSDWVESEKRNARAYWRAVPAKKKAAA